MTPSELPEPGQTIEVVVLGETFVGQFLKAYQPWNTAWLIDADFFGRKVKKIFSTNHISEWRSITA